MTGATGDLTPDEIQRDLVTGERREVSDPERQADVTQAQAARAPAQSGDLGDPGGDLVEGGPTNMAIRESGYGSEHGLSPEDPAYRMDVRPDGKTRSSEPRGRGGAGGDDVSDHEERF